MRGFSSWQLVSPPGYPLTNQSTGALVFLDASTGLLLGRNWHQTEPRTTPAPTTSSIFRTTDGGHHWRLQLVGTGRCFILGAHVEGSVYAVELHSSSADSAHEFSRLLRSDDGGLSWQPLGQVPGWASTMAFADAAQGFIVTNYPAGPDASFYHTTDGGLSWQPIRLQQPLSVMDGVALPNQQAWLLTKPPGPFAAEGLAHVDWRTGAVRTEALPDCVVPASPIVDAAGNLWLAGAADDGAALLLRREAHTGRYTQVYRLVPAARQYLGPMALHLSGRSVSLLMLDSTPGQGGYRFIHSPDLGRTWREEPLPAACIALPFTFCGAGHAWFATDDGQLLLRQPGR